MRDLSGAGSHLMLHAMPPPPPEELAEAHVPYNFTAAAADCADLLRQTGWNPAPAITYTSALSDVKTAFEPSATLALLDALSAAPSSCDSLSDAFASYFIPACT
jgi:hypothetical protein